MKSTKSKPTRNELRNASKLKKGVTTCKNLQEQILEETHETQGKKNADSYPWSVETLRGG